MKTETIDKYISKLDIELPALAIDQFTQLIILLEKWNKAFNLTAVRDPKDMVVLHLLDSLAPLSFVEGPEVLDVGTGAGFPGLPMAIAKPDWQFTLLDSNSKKTRFVTQAVIELGLKNVKVITGRAENSDINQQFNTIMCRATFALGDFLSKTHDHCVNKGLFLALKGSYPKQEIDDVCQPAKSSDKYRDLATKINIEATESIQVPGLDAERHVVLVRKK
jgi:16S rRNA (guanine527-N7)-methyltransferase